MAHALAELRRGCLSVQHLGGQFWEVVWTLRDPSGLKPWLSIAAVVTIHHFNDLSSLHWATLLFLHSSHGHPRINNLCNVHVLDSIIEGDQSNTLFFFYCRGGERMGLSDLVRRNFPSRVPFLSQETMALFLSVEETLKNLHLSEPSFSSVLLRLSRI